MTHKMRLKPTPYSMISRGIKTFELRLYDEKRRQLKVGDVIEFTNEEGVDRLLCEVTGLHVFGSFDELYSTLPLLKCGYTKENVSDASPEDMCAYYPLEEQKKYGVVGIEIILKN